MLGKPDTMCLMQAQTKLTDQLNATREANLTLGSKLEGKKSELRSCLETVSSLQQQIQESASFAQELQDTVDTNNKALQVHHVFMPDVLLHMCCLDVWVTYAYASARETHAQQAHSMFTLILLQMRGIWLKMLQRPAGQLYIPANQRIS